MPRSLTEWLETIEHLHPREIDLGLERVQEVAARLGLLPERLATRIITVAGTNGKGSLVHALQAQCHACGRSVLAYTSPHLVRYNERICLDGAPVADDELCAAFEAIYAAGRDVALTYFEFGTLAALWICRQRRPEVLLLEVGMGGRLDAVNVIDADLAVLTSVELDHCDWLGETREQIGYEKAGIFRTGRPALCADRNPPPSVRRQAEAVGACLLSLGREFDCRTESDGAWVFGGRGVANEMYQEAGLQLPGSVDTDLAALVMQVCALAELPFDPQALDSRPAGRWQVLEAGGREIILDVAHNPAATGRMAERLASLAPKPTRAVFGLLAGRDAIEVTRPLWPYVSEWLLVQTEGARGCSAQSLSRILSEAGQQATALGPGVAPASELPARTRPGERILVFGSFQVVGALLAPDLKHLRTYQPWTG